MAKASKWLLTKLDRFDLPSWVPQAKCVHVFDAGAYFFGQRLLPYRGGLYFWERRWSEIEQFQTDLVLER